MRLYGSGRMRGEAYLSDIHMQGARHWEGRSTLAVWNVWRHRDCSMRVTRREGRVDHATAHD
jgi:hypothetical protein